MSSSPEQDENFEEFESDCPGDCHIGKVVRIPHHGSAVFAHELAHQRAHAEQESKRKDDRQEFRRRKQDERLNTLKKVRQEYSWIENLPVYQAVPAQRTMLHADRVFRFVSLLVPRRLANEEIGDALDLMAEHFKRSPKRWPVYLKLVTTVLWILVNTVRHVMKGSKAEGTKKTSGE